MSSPRTRLAAGVAAWLAAVGAALAVGIGAVSAIGTGLLGPAQQPLSPAEVETRLAAADGPAPVEPTPGGSAPVEAGAAPEVIATAGGTVLARCTGDRPEVVAATPAQGFRVQTEDDDGGPRIRFRAGKARFEVRLTCTDGHPAAAVTTDG